MATTQTPVAAGYTAESLVQASQQATSDLSAQSMLVKIFGTIADNPLAAIEGTQGAGDILGTIFMFVNLGLLTLGSIYLSYKALAAITQTAHEGEFMGQAFNSVWVPIRITTGIFSLIPIAGGWSIIQVAMLWFGIMGAGLGNMAWNGVVGANFLPVQSLTLSPVSGGSTTKGFAPELFRMHACVAAHNAQIANEGWDSRLVDNGSEPTPTLRFGSNNGANAECGKISMAQFSRGTGAAYSGSWASWSIWASYDQKITVQKAAQAEFDLLNADMQKRADSFINGPGGVKEIMYNPDNVQSINKTVFSATELRQISDNYRLRLSNAVSKAMTSTNLLDKPAQAMRLHAQTDGFTSAGAFYLTMAQTSYAMNSIAQNVAPTIDSTAQVPASNETLWKTAYNMINDSENAAQVRKINVDGTTSDQDTAWKLIMKEMHGSGATWMNPGQSIVNWLITEGSGEPVVIRLKNMADKVVVIASAVLTSSGVVEGVIEAAKGNFLIGSIATLATGALKPWINMLQFASSIAVGFFLMASIYLPMIPFIIFMGQILNWLITVVEGVAAAPFLAFAHLDTDGEGLGHKTQYGYTFMLSSFMRPVMLVLGFVFACILLETIGGFVMAIFPMVLADVQIDSMTGLFSILGFSAIFLVMMTGLINSSMSVTYLLPDAIFAFIGAHSSATAQVGRNEVDNMKASVGGSTAIMRYAQPDMQEKRGGGNTGGVKSAKSEFEPGE